MRNTILLIAAALNKVEKVCDIREDNLENCSVKFYLLQEIVSFTTL